MPRKNGNAAPPKKPPQRVSLPFSPVFTPPPGSPFAGISGTHAPAHNLNVPHLTAHVALARAQRERLTQGGLLTPTQRASETKAARTLAAPPGKASPPARRTKAAAPAARSRTALPSPTVSSRSPFAPSARTPLLPLGLTRPSTAPFVVPLPSAPSSAQPHAGLRGAGLLSIPSSVPSGMGQSSQSILTGPLLGRTGAAKVAHAIDLGVGTAAAAATPSLTSDARHPIAAYDAIRKRGLVTSEEAATGLSHLGVKGGIPHGFTLPGVDVVAPAGAATIKRPITPAELKALEKQGYDLSPRLDKLFTSRALKNGYSSAELDGASGSDKIDMAFSHPAALPLRVLGHLGGGIVRLGALPAAGVGISKEVAAGRGGGVLKALGGGLTAELPIVGNHPAADTAVADPLGFFTQFAGAGKTIGAASGIARGLKAAEGATAAERVIGAAGSGMKIPRPTLDRNAWNATGQLIGDRVTSRVPLAGRLAERQTVDRLQRRLANETTMPHVVHHQTLTDARKAIGDKRAAELLAYQHAGGEPGRIAAFYKTQTGAEAARQARDLEHVAKVTQDLSPADHAYLDAHAAMARHTSEAYVKAGVFTKTALRFRQYSPLIRAAAHAGDPTAKTILDLRSALSAHGATGALDLPALATRDAAHPEPFQSSVASMTAAHDQAFKDLLGHYADAVKKFAARHEARGGMEPSRVAYSTSDGAPSSGPGLLAQLGHQTGLKPLDPGAPAETGAMFESGRYLVDPNSPITENLRAQHAALSAALVPELVRQVGRRAKPGDVLPRDWAFLPDAAIAAARQRASHDIGGGSLNVRDYHAGLEDAHRFTREHLTTASKLLRPGAAVPAGAAGFFVPRSALARIMDHVAPAERNAYDRLVGHYQRALISYRPSTVLNNTLGSIPMAILGGAYHPSDWWLAGKAMRDRTIAPAVLRGHGLAGAAARPALTKIGRYPQALLRLSRMGEDFSKLASYFSKSGRGLRKRAEAANMSATELLRAEANGTVNRDLQEKFIDHAEAFLSDQLKPDHRIGLYVGRGIMFHRWVGHVAKLLLYTLPVKHPRRAVILNDLAQYGDAYRKSHGVYPDWYISSLPLFQHVERLGSGGVSQTFTRTFSTAGVNPFATLENAGSSLSTADPPLEIVRSALNPVAQTPYNYIVGPPARSPAGTSRLGYVAAQAVRSIPGVSVVKPQAGMNPDSIPFLRERQRVYSSGHYWGGHSLPLPYAFRPGARPQGGALGAAERFLFGSVSDLPAQGPVHQIEQRKHIGAVAKHARTHQWR